MLPPFVQELFDTFAAVKAIDYAPVINKLLFHYFPMEDGFSNYSCKKRINRRGRPIKPWFLTLQHNTDAVLVMHMRCADDISSPALRAHADEELRTILRRFTPEDTRAPKISAVSCFGPKFCLYEYDIGTKTITPEVPSKGRVPAKWYNHDFETHEGVATFEQFAADVTLLARNLPDDWPSIVREQQVAEEQPTSDHGVTTRSRSRVVNKQPTSNYGGITRSRSKK